jgi:hypothetical protein
LPTPSRIWEYLQLPTGQIERSGKHMEEIKDTNFAIISSFLTAYNISNILTINLLKGYGFS